MTKKQMKRVIDLEKSLREDEGSEFHQKIGNPNTLIRTKEIMSPELKARLALAFEWYVDHFSETN